MTKQDLIKKLVYVSFCEYSEGGIVYQLYNEDMRKYFEDKDDIQLLCEVMVPVAKREDILTMGVKTIDKKIADCALEIARLNAQKQQLLAIEHKGE